MKMIHVSIFLCSGLLLAQAPKPGGKEPPRGPGVKASLMNPASLRAKAPDVFKAQFTTTERRFRGGSASRLVTQWRRSFLQSGEERLLRRRAFFTAWFPISWRNSGLTVTPKIDAAWVHANIRDDAVKQGNKRGRITYAMAGPNTRTTRAVHQLQRQQQSG